MTDVWRFYERHAQTFDRERGKSLIERPYLDAVASRLQPGAGVLDIGWAPAIPLRATSSSTGTTSPVWTRRPP
jgi:hypothetical protein